MYEDTKEAGCGFAAGRSSSSLRVTRGGGSKPTRTTTERRGPVSSQIFPLAYRTRTLLLVSSKIANINTAEELGTWNIGIWYARLLLIMASSNKGCIHVDDELGNGQMANSYEAVVRVAIADPDLRNAVYEDTERAGCSFAAERSSPSLYPTRGGGSKPTGRTTAGHGPVTLQSSLRGSRARTLITVSSKIVHIHIADGLGNTRVAISYEAVIQHAITDPALQSAAYVNTRGAGCSFAAERSSPSLYSTRGGRGKPTRTNAERRGPISP